MTEPFRVTKAPAAALDYAFDWSAWLGVDSIASVRWVVPDGLTRQSAQYDATKATIWLSGGTTGRTYAVQCQITTAAGRIDQRQLLVEVKPK